MCQKKFARRLAPPRAVPRNSWITVRWKRLQCSRDTERSFFAKRDIATRGKAEGSNEYRFAKKSFTFKGSIIFYITKDLKGRLSQSIFGWEWYTIFITSQRYLIRFLNFSKCLVLFQLNENRVICISVKFHEYYSKLTYSVIMCISADTLRSCCNWVINLWARFIISLNGI